MKANKNGGFCRRLLQIVDWEQHVQLSRMGLMSMWLHDLCGVHFFDFGKTVWILHYKDYSTSYWLCNRCWLFTFCAGLTAGLDIVLRALCIMTGAGDVAVPFLVSDVTCPDVVSVLFISVLNTPELCANPDPEAGRGLAACPPVGEPEGSQLVLWGETLGVAAEPPSCCCLVRMNPLLPVTEPCGSSVSGTPFSFTKSKVLLLTVAELRVGFLCLMSSHSVPLNIASAVREEASLSATSLSPSMDQNQKHKTNC